MEKITKGLGKLRVKNESECSACYGTEKLVRLPCNMEHCLCFPCLREMLKRNDRLKQCCPLCRANFFTEDEVREAEESTRLFRTSQDNIWCSNCWKALETTASFCELCALLLCDGCSVKGKVKNFIHQPQTLCPSCVNDICDIRLKCGGQAKMETLLARYDPAPDAPTECFFCKGMVRRDNIQACKKCRKEACNDICGYLTDKGWFCEGCIEQKRK
jgi:hypothetical protein